MYASIFLRNNNLRSNSAILSTARRCYGQIVFLRKPTLTRVLQNPFTVRLSGPLNKNISTLRSDALSRNQKILAKENGSNFAPVRAANTSTLDVNTDVINNVFLYKYNRPKLFMFLNLFAPFQCIFWVAMAYYFYTKLPKRNYNEQSLVAYLKDQFLIVLVCGFATFLGTSSAALIWLFSARSVKYLILNKGGEAVTFLTYHPWKGNVGTTIPLEKVCHYLVSLLYALVLLVNPQQLDEQECKHKIEAQISCKTSRREMNNYMTLKAEGRSFFYILDAGGDFVNPRLFDHTVGFMRIKK